MMIAALEAVLTARNEVRPTSHRVGPTGERVGVPVPMDIATTKLAQYQFTQLESPLTQEDEAEELGLG
jgi:hypothetical protein